MTTKVKSPDAVLAEHKRATRTSTVSYMHDGPPTQLERDAAARAIRKRIVTGEGGFMVKWRNLSIEQQHKLVGLAEDPGRDMDEFWSLVRTAAGWSQ